MKAARSILMLIFGIIISLNTFAQSRQLQKTDSVFRVIKKHIATKNADAIYDLTDTGIKQIISQGNFRDYLFRDLFSLGVIKKDSLISFVNNVTAAYQLQFENQSKLLTISLANNNQVSYFFLEPYKANQGNKPAPVATTNPLKSTTDKIIDSVVRRYIQKSNTVGLSIGLIKDGKTTIYNYGETKSGNGKLPTANTIFEIGSISKTFTATILAWYVNQGKLSLTDPIIKYLPDSVAANPALKNITLLNLTNHTSGLARLPLNLTRQKSYDNANPYINYTQEMLFTYLKNCSLNSEPGKKYIYSNLAVGLLGVILERVSNKSYEQLVTEIICRPLSMKSTVQKLNPQLLARFASVYDEEGHETPAWDFDALAAGGSLKSTMTDMLIYTKANMAKADNKLSKAFELTHQPTTTTDTRVGLGWHIVPVAGVDYYFHNGGTGGSSSYLLYNAEKGLAIVVLSNATASTDPVGGGIIKAIQ
jgi:CubicO group peptidase (beta-lactamase class C family)